MLRDLLTNDGGLHVRDAVEVFLNAGYSVNLEKVYAQGYGVPQRRKRVLIVGNRMGHDFVFPDAVTLFSGNIFRKGEITFSTAMSDAAHRRPRKLARLSRTSGRPKMSCRLISGEKRRRSRTTLFASTLGDPIGAGARVDAGAD